MTPRMLRCSFCGRSQYEVKALFAGHNVNICDECVRLCAWALAEQGSMPKGTGQLIGARLKNRLEGSPGMEVWRMARDVAARWG